MPNKYEQDRINEPNNELQSQSEKFLENFRSFLPWLPKSTPIENLPKFTINDLTLRDGKQALAWWNLWTKQQGAEFVNRLADAGVHSAELGFPVLKGDPETDSVAHIVESVKERDIVLMALARLVRGDISTAIRTLAPAKYKGIHTFIGTSPEHRESRGFSVEQIKKMVRDRVKQIVDAGYLCEFSCEDATRTELEVLKEVYGVAAEEGAGNLNIPDTLGYADMFEYGGLLEELRKEFPDQILSTHTHNDRSLAEANAEVGILTGNAHRVEGTVYGIGERAGNADWVRLVMSLYSRGIHDEKTGRSTLYKSLSDNLLSNRSGVAEILAQFEQMSGLHQRPVAPAFGYEALVSRSGVHQAEVRKMKKTYIWQVPTEFGFDPRPEFDITPLSGKHGVSEVYESLGIELDGETSEAMTNLLRMLFSPDSKAANMRKRKAYKHMSLSDLKSLKERIENIRCDAHKMKNTEERHRAWEEEGHKILIDTLYSFDEDYQFGKYNVEKFDFGPTDQKNEKGNTIYHGMVVVNGTEYTGSGVGEVNAVVNAIRKVAAAKQYEYHPGAVIPLTDNDSDQGEMRAHMIDKVTGNEVELFVRDLSTTGTHIKAFIRGMNQLRTLRKYQKKQAKMDAV